MTETPNNETLTQILAVADELFSKRGYADVTLRDIASAVGVRHASLYYYVPGGKEQLFIQVIERNLHRHRRGMERAIAGAGADLRAQMHAVADWLLSQPPLDFMRMSHSDMPAIRKDEAERLSQLALDTLSSPIVAALAQAAHTGSVAVRDAGMAAMALVSLIESVHAIPEEPLRQDGISRQQIAHEMVDMMLYGWFKR